MEKELTLRGDEYQLTLTKLNGPYSHLLNLNCEDGAGSATMTESEALKLAIFLFDTIGEKLVEFQNHYGQERQESNSRRSKD